MLEVVKEPATQPTYEIQLLSTKELFDTYWGQCIPFLQECVDRAMHGEMTVEDIYTRALQGHLYVIVAKDDTPEVPDVKMVIALELVTYPKFTAMSVVALGGRDLRHMIKKFWKQVCGWAQVCGVKHIECLVAPAMERILETQGFKRKYTLLRQDLTEVLT
tara:strand:+ start:543 stop:1025 length:483 start_codon:yes stop_codon:yes gene_type:complete